MNDPGRVAPRLLFVHAHPDDETITTGATMARYAATGAQVSLITCTRGERGEVIPPELAALEGDGPALAAVRERELALAMAALGVRDHRFLGARSVAPQRLWTDSGMDRDDAGRVILPRDVAPSAFALASVDDAGALLAETILDLRPHAVITYEAGGGYGHPDHVQAHRVTMRAVELAGAQWPVPALYWVVLPASVAGRRDHRLRTDPGNPFDLPPDGAPAPSMIVADELVDVSVDGSRFEPAKRAALVAHATQILLADDAPFFALSNRIGAVLSGVEYFHLVRSHSVLTAPPRAGDLVERDYAN